jgi:hypothetical protein
MAAWQWVPVAWAAVASNGQPLWLSYDRHDAERALRGTVKVVPLYAAPPASSVRLTDEERRELEAAASDYEHGGGRIVYGRQTYLRRAATIRGLLARATKEGR